MQSSLPLFESMDNDPLARIEQLRAEIARHDELYYRQAQPEISDQQYDALKSSLAELENIHGTPSDPSLSPTSRVGDDRLDAFESYRHRAPMLSLDNTYNENELRDFGIRLQKRFPGNPLTFVIEPKIDGVAVSLTYENGRLVRAVTRGNGTEGDDITQNIRHIPGLDQALGQNAPTILEIRGEIYMRHAEFERINESRSTAGLPLYANPRNLAAGTVKLLDPAEARQRQLDIVLYAIGYAEPASTFTSQSEVQEKLRAWSLPVLEKFWQVEGIESALSAISELDTLRQQFAYPTDGAVVKLDDFQLQNEAGFTSKAPRWAIAYKFEAERAETRLREITVQIGRTGVLTPVAILDPVHLAGTIVSRATLHNEDEIRRKDIRPGDTVIVQKAGEIIPQVLGVNLALRPATSQPFDYETHLQALGLEAERLPGQAVWRLAEQNTPGQIRRRIEHFAGRTAMDVENLGTAVIQQLVENGSVQTIADLYKLSYDDLIELEKIADKSARNLLDSIEKSKAAELWRLIHGLGIPHVGAQTAKELARAFPDLDTLAQATTEELEAIEGIGTIMAQSIHAFFEDPSHQAILAALKAAGLRWESTQASTTGDSPLNGKTFVLTGTLPTLTRQQATEKIETTGGKVASSVSAKTDYLLAGESTGSKFTKAQKLNIPILNEPDFLALLESTLKKGE